MLVPTVCVTRSPKVSAPVAIATPPATHYAIARRALECGLDVFVEKPLALDLAAGRRLCEIAEREGRILMVGHVLRYHPAYRALQRIAHSGELGRLQYIYSQRLNFGRIRTEENILWSFAPHDVSMILGLAKDESSRRALLLVLTCTLAAGRTP